MKSILGILAGLVVLVAVFAFARGSAPVPAVSTHDAATPTAASQQSSATPAPVFSLKTIDGGTISLADYRGKKPVILDFWATWCPNCRRDIPHQNEWYKKYKDRIEVIGVNLQEDPSVVKAFAAQFGIAYPVALDSEQSASRAYGANYTNFHVLIDREGNIVKTIPGDISESDFTSLIGS